MKFSTYVFVALLVVPNFSVAMPAKAYTKTTKKSKSTNLPSLSCDDGKLMSDGTCFSVNQVEMYSDKYGDASFRSRLYNEILSQTKQAHRDKQEYYGKFLEDVRTLSGSSTAVSNDSLMMLLGVNEEMNSDAIEPMNPGNRRLAPTPAPTTSCESDIVTIIIGTFGLVLNLLGVAAGGVGKSLSKVIGRSRMDKIAEFIDTKVPAKSVYHPDDFFKLIGNLFAMIMGDANMSVGLFVKGAIESQPWYDDALDLVSFTAQLASWLIPGAFEIETALKAVSLADAIARLTLTIFAAKDAC